MPLVPTTPFKRDLGNLPSLDIERLIQNQKKIDPAMIEDLRKRGSSEIWEDLLGNHPIAGTRLDAYSKETERATGIQLYTRPPTQNFRQALLPLETLNLRDTSDYVVGSASAGAALVETEIQDRDPIAPLRATSAILRAGTQLIETERHNIAIPRINVAPFAGSGETSTTWVTAS